MNCLPTNRAVGSADDSPLTPLISQRVSELELYRQDFGCRRGAGVGKSSCFWGFLAGRLATEPHTAFILVTAP